MLRKGSVAFVLSMILCSIVMSQERQLQSQNGRPQTVEEALIRHGISLDEPSLLVALSNSSPQVRGLAAIQLGVKKGKDALPDLLAALSAEKEPNAKVTIALEAARLGDEIGVIDLRAMCDDKAATAAIRLQAALYLRELKDDYCYKTIEGLVATAPDPDSRINAVYLLSNAESLSRHDSRKVRRLVVRAL